ncbi:MAG: tetratricopeptide repeat protein [Acidobacteria bacterium]|nr:tetratricopeptide repeat protein [Acidobacteriota bacterium]
MEQRPSHEQVRAVLSKIVSSAGFADAGRLPGFLTHLVERTLAGETDRLKESVLGMEAFQRDAGFDPRIDPIVRVEARRLRSRLEEYYAGPGAEDQVVIGLPKGGYIPVFELRAGAEAKEEEGAGSLPRGWKLAGILAGLAAVGIGLGFWQANYMRRVTQAPAATVAVLPFENVGAEPENEYFSLGLTEEIIDRLSRVPGLKVVARSLMAQFQKRPASLDEVRQKVGASVVVEGSVRRQGDRLRVVARLAKVSDGASLWSQIYERKAKDVFAIQDEIAQSVANALRVQVRSGREPASKARATENLEAYNLYLRGRQQLNLASEEGLRRAIFYFEDALKLEPGYAPALASQSMAYSLAGYYALKLDMEPWTKARNLAEQAIRLDAGLAEAHTSLGLSLAFHYWKWADSEAAFRKALEVDQSSALAHGLYAIALLAPENRMAEAEREFQLALELDPNLNMASYGYGYCLLASGRYEEAAQQYRRALELKAVHQDVYWDYGMALGMAGKNAEARQAMMQARKVRGERELEPRALEAFYSGDRARAEADAPLLENEAREGKEDYMDAARLWAALGQKERAIDCLQLALQRREPQMIWVKSDPRLKPLAGDPRMAALVAAVGLPPGN